MVASKIRLDKAHKGYVRAISYVKVNPMCEIAETRLSTAWTAYDQALTGYHNALCKHTQDIMENRVIGINLTK